MEVIFREYMLENNGALFIVSVIIMILCSVIPFIIAKKIIKKNESN